MRQKLAEFLDAIMGFRKFIAFLLLLAISIMFRSVNFINGSEFVDLMKNIGIAFFATNGVEHFTSMAKDYIASKVAERAAPAPGNEP